MKHLNRLFLTLLITLTLFSCNNDDSCNINIEIESKKVNFSTNKLITSSNSEFGNKTIQQYNYTTYSDSDNDYTHIFPSTYTAYFVSKENKGQYVTNQVVLVVEVVAGDNEIEIPMLNYDVYVTNYNHPDYDETQSFSWYTWETSITQLPQSSNDLYLFGSNEIDYSLVDEGEVTLINPYSGIMISDNQYVTSQPLYQGDNQYYFSGNDYWYVKYIRNSTTNTMIPINVPGYSGTQYQLNQPIEPNKIYKYIINGDAGSIEDGNLTIIVEDFEDETTEVIDILN